MPPSPKPSRLCTRASFSNPSWLYPLKGIYYFTTHRRLHPLLRARLLPCALLSIFILALLFTFTYLPQALFLLLFHGKLAWFNAAFLVLGEGAVVIALLFEAFLVDETLVDVFDAVLVAEGCEELVATQRILVPDAPRGLGARERGAVYSPFSIRQIIEFIVFLPFNLIPWVGTPVFLLLTGYRAGPLHHWRYWRLLGLTKKERKAVIKKRGLKYTWFGTVALLLQLVPGLSMLFLLTTAAGSALWVVDLERARTGRGATAEERAQEGDEEADAPPEYTEEYADDPV